MPDARPPTPLSDPELIDAFRRGDEFAFVTLYERHKGAVFGYCRKMLLDPDAAADVFQETFARAYEHRARLLNSTSFKAWLFTIARNQCLNALRKRGRTQPLPDAEPPAPDGATPLSRLLRSEQTAVVTKTLAELPPAYREVLVLREYQNLSYDEISAVTQSTLSAVKSRLFKARRALAVALKPWMTDAPAPAVAAAAASVAPRLS